MLTRFPMSGDEYAVGRLLVLNSLEAVPQVLIGGRLVKITGREEPFDVFAEDGVTTVGWVTTGRNGSDEPILTYSQPAPNQAEMTEETTIILHGLGPDRSGFSVSGPLIVRDGKDTFSMVCTGIGCAMLALLILVLLGILGSVVNGY